MGAMAYQITSLAIVYSTIYPDTDQRRHKRRVTGLCEGDSPVTGELPSKRPSNAKDVFIRWRHQEK